ncbi:CopD family protein [Erythrobacter sp. HL-111]|uniref:CopD family protein n=1 Tax=Erythrobacter sp. HL-111 TaxID=1798193 RepID=UPI0006DA50EA|nr:CopD family protein [Erythrobacter sp. HL-111]KPP88617.1 MAG: putative membrane protein [Erythrobacteraceae bacterium HL-111]SDS31960.1 Uncharacterized membrane protein [Erythrobacter sp. HL-111]
MLWLKFLHIAGVSVWVAGLLYLAALLAGHSTVQDQQDFARIRMASRFAYMGLVSPAAFAAVAAGSGLLFLSDALHPWMFAKLGAVVVLVMVQVQYAYVLVHLADEGAREPTLRIAIMVAAIVVAALAILFLVLAKPALGDEILPAWLSEPGFLTRSEDPVSAPARSRLPHRG